MHRPTLQSFLPDDKPITALAVLEDAQKCPNGYTVITKTLDQDSDADMWRESAFFSRKTRYLCISKSEGVDGYIVENISVINEKELPPDGFCLIARTIDSELKAWRKRQICYRLTRRSLAKTCISDIILQAKSKKPLEGYVSAGDLNGLTLCYKSGINVNETPTENGGLYNLLPFTPSDINSSYVNLPAANGKQRAPSPESVVDLKPCRPAPRPPSNYATIGPDEGLRHVPFVLNPLIDNSISNALLSVPNVKSLTSADIDTEYSYDFKLEKALLQTT